MTRPDAPSAEIEALFQDHILDHYRRPRNKGSLPDATARGSVVNPTCGDEVVVEIALEGDVVRTAKFTGRGCSISQASASMMTSAASGRSRAELHATAQQLEALLRGDVTDASQLGDLSALGGVARFPARISCALMPWRALAIALA